MRVGFVMPDGHRWTGGRHYFLNLFRALDKYGGGRVVPVVFFDPKSHSDGMEEFSDIKSIEVVPWPSLDRSQSIGGLAASILWGRNPKIWNVLKKNDIDVVFESAQYYGWRPGIPVLAWIPDFQHRFLRSMFPFSLWWKRELGYWLQTGNGRTILLSSEDARKSCEKFYPSSRGKTRVVRFAVPPVRVSSSEAEKIRHRYSLPEHFFYLPNQFWRHKNHMLVLEALREIKARHKRVVVAASGNQSDVRDPEYYPSIVGKIKDYGLVDMFRVLGLIPYSHVRSLMRSASALLNPSLFEGWSTTVEEAKSMGTPLILSDIDVHMEQAGNEAVYFDRHSSASLANALMEFQPLSREERELRMQNAAKLASQRVEEYVREFLLVIRELVGDAD